MNFNAPNREEINPFLQLLLLLFYALVGALIFALISLSVSVGIHGFSLVSNLSLITTGDPKYINDLKIFQILTAMGTFVLPPLALAYTNQKKPSNFYSFASPNGISLILVLVIMAASMPFMEWTAIWNQKMVLPPLFKGVENWMKLKEAEGMKMTIQLITVRSNWDFALNLVMIAVIPALGEELMFRGGIQRSVDKLFGNPHVAIWLSAFIFSAIHLQFYGFVPRLLLGAGFGYLYYYGGSIWYAILGHFLNNAFAVCQAFYMQKHHIPLDKAEDSIGFPLYACIFSAIITIALFKYFKDNAERERKLG